MSTVPNHTRVSSLERTGVRLSSDPRPCGSWARRRLGTGTPRRQRCRRRDERDTTCVRQSGLGRIRGIEIGVHWSLLVIGVLVVGTLASSLLPDLGPTRAAPTGPRRSLGDHARSSPRSSPTSSSHASSRCGDGQRVERHHAVAPRRRRQPPRRSARPAQRVPRRDRRPGHEPRAGRGFVAVGSALDATLPDGSLLPAVAI